MAFKVDCGHWEGRRKRRRKRRRRKKKGGEGGASPFSLDIYVLSEWEL